MTSKAKLVVGGLVVAAGVAAYVLTRKKKSPSGQAILSEYTILDCKCWRTDRHPDGRTVSTRVSRAWCALDGLTFDDCPAATFEDMFPPSETKVWTP